MLKRLPLLIAAALLLSGAAAQAQVRIGLAAPLTGPDAGFGQGMRIGAEQAVADINKAGGIAGQKIRLVVQDDAGEPKQGVAVAKKFAADGVKFVVGPLDSGVTASALPVFDEAGILALTPGATWSALTERGAWNLFRLGGNDLQQATLAGSTLADRFRDRPVAFVNDKTSFGHSLAEEAARVFKSRGGREGLFEGIARGERDFSGLVAKMKRARVGAVYFGGLSTEAALLIKAMREAGLTVPLMGSDGLVDKDFAALGGPGVEGTLMTLAPDPKRVPEQRGAKQPRSTEADLFASRTYAAFEVLKAGIEATKSTDPRRVAEFLHSGKAIRTLVGEIAFDARGDLAAPPFEVRVWRSTPDGRIDYAGNEP